MERGEIGIIGKAEVNVVTSIKYMPTYGEIKSSVGQVHLMELALVFWGTTGKKNIYLNSYKILA